MMIIYKKQKIFWVIDLNGFLKIARLIIRKI